MSININAMLIGCVSSGKSSLLNSLVGGIVSPAFKDRQTFEPITYYLHKTGLFSNLCEISKQINDQKTKNNEFFNNEIMKEEIISNINTKYIDLNLKYTSNLTITDFPEFDM